MTAAPSPIQIPNCLRVVRDGMTFYKGSFPSDIASRITQVHVFEQSASNHVTETQEVNGQEGYQRPALKSRQKKFAEYLSRHGEGTAFTPPIVLNARGCWNFEPYQGIEHFGTLSITGPANVIDGQHRLGGFVAHFEDIGEIRSIDFMAYDELSQEQEKWVFHTINTNQKGVPSALSVIIDDTERHNRIARRIGEESSSPFAGRISMAGSSGKHYLWKLNAIAKNVDRMFKGGMFDDTSEESLYDIFVTYWQKIQETHTDAWDDFDKTRPGREYKLLELTGFIAYCRLFNDRFKHLYNSVENTMDWNAIEKDLDELAGRLDLRKDGQFKGQTGEYGASQILLMMQQIFAQPPPARLERG